MDFRKEFDKFDYNIIINVLKNSGFGELPLVWFFSYLFNLKQYIKVSGVKFDVFNVSPGVSQRHLTPLLFALFIMCKQRS